MNQNKYRYITYLFSPLWITVVGLIVTFEWYNSPVVLLCLFVLLTIEYFIAQRGKKQIVTDDKRLFVVHKSHKYIQWTILCVLLLCLFDIIEVSVSVIWVLIGFNYVFFFCCYIVELNRILYIEK